MPFDMLPQKSNRLLMLERLLELLDRPSQTDAAQRRYCNCLLHEAAADPVLLGLGFPPPPRPGWEEDFVAGVYAITAKRAVGLCLFLTHTVAVKRRLLRRAIAHESRTVLA